jgi:hypothetical protein
MWQRHRKFLPEKAHFKRNIAAYRVPSYSGGKYFAS